MVTVTTPPSYVAIPSIVFWILLPIIIYEIRSSRIPKLQWSTLMSLKWLIGSVLVIDRFFVFLLAVWEALFEHIAVRSELFMYPFLHSFTLLAVLVATNEVRRAGIHSSGPLFCTWLLFTLFGIPEFIDWISVGSKPELVTNIDFFRYLAYLVYFPLIVVQFCLHFVSDPFSYSNIRAPNKCPEEEASFLSRQFLFWMSSLFSLGNKRPIEVEDIYDLDSNLDITYLKEQWNKAWTKQVQVSKKKAEAENKGKGEKSPLLTEFGSYGAVKPDVKDPVLEPSILAALWDILKWDIIGGSIIKLFNDMLNYANPLFLNFLILFIEQPGGKIYVGVAYALGLFFAGQLRSLLMSNYFVTMNRVGIKMQAILSTAVYAKALKLSSSGRKERTVGEIVNLMSIDVERFRLISSQLHQYWSSPLQIIICMVVLWQTVGVAVWAGILIMVSVIPLNFYVSIVTKKYQMKLMQYKDKRIRLINEVLNGIKVVKLSAWEMAMEEEIEKVRQQELDMIKKSSHLLVISDSLNIGIPVFVALSTFTVYTTMSADNVLNPNIAFVSLSLFNLLRAPLIMAADLVSQTVQVTVSNKRLKSFFAADELDESMIDNELPGELYKESVEMENGNFKWESDGKKEIRNVNFKVPTGHLVAVVGSVGSGKSSLLSAILGEMEKDSGYVGVRGTVAYLPQQPWVLNQTLKENIVMKSEYDEARYSSVIEACALRDDLKQLPNGDKTEIGEKGINLSGGQKSRVALARAVYQLKQVYFLDDPLSAVDAHVARHIFNNVIGPNGVLSGSTRILVTNCTSFLQEADRIIVMQNGEITHYDTYDNLIANEDVKHYLHEVDQTEKEKSESSEESDKESDSVLSRVSERSSKRKKSRVSLIDRQVSQKGKLIVKEEAASGKVKFTVYMLYFKAMGIFKFVLPYLTAIVLNMVFGMSRSLWLTAWSDANVDPNVPDTTPLYMRLIVYFIFGMLEVLCLYLSLLTIMFGGLAASKNLHRPLLHNVLRAPLSYFDVTPIGRIINRLSKDIEIVDLRISMSFRFVVISVINMLQTTIMVTYATPWFMAVIIPVFIVYTFILRYSMKTTRQLQRVTSLTRSPIFSNFSETVQGLSTIRAFNWKEEFVNRNDEHLVTHARCLYYGQMSSRWLSIRLELLGNVVILAAAMLAILSKYYGNISPGVIGLSVSSSLNITFMMNMFVRQVNELETNVVSVERIDEYTKTKTEAEWRRDEDNQAVQWPTKGRVDFDNYSTRYRDGLELVLNDITLNIIPGQKVGVCGRTGAGKSSLALALFRIVEPSQGRIDIDNVDTTTLGLHKLRENITIIPQENVMFANTLRFNLDPTEEFKDAELWQALEHSNLLTFVENLPSKLEHMVSEGGENMSVGQRQLLCLARALLRKSKILVLDEATAGIDNNTDALVQETIRREFAESTIITIAHRLNTIMDYDRILVMESGRIVEDGSPSELLKNKSSKFFGLAKSSKLV